MSAPHLRWANDLLCIGVCSVVLLCAAALRIYLANITDSGSLKLSGTYELHRENKGCYLTVNVVITIVVDGDESRRKEETESVGQTNVCMAE